MAAGLSESHRALLAPVPSCRPWPPLHTGAASAALDELCWSSSTRNRRDLLATKIGHRKGFRLCVLAFFAGDHGTLGFWSSVV